MGRRKKDSAEARKEANKTIYMAKLMNNPTSPQKTRLVADLVRGVDGDEGIFALQGGELQLLQIGGNDFIAFFFTQGSQDLPAQVAECTG